MERQLEERLLVHAATIKQDLALETAPAVAVTGVSRADVETIARQTLALYDADKTGKFDYALESAGGSVVSTKCTESYNVKSARISVLGIPLWYASNNPRTIIQPHMSPGECFAFRGQGYFVIALSRRIVPTGFVMEHISRNLTPSAAIDSAPREFTVLGLADPQDREGVVLGDYVYEEAGPPLQEFGAQVVGAADFSVVELRVKSNWGHPNYTCVYRFRVHGAPTGPDGA
ncbi:SUN domain-containing protein 2-like [Pollicipes pollicipes]|nr:SUN domain-containing protein 2-like [Pollicipes pollicipes]